LVLALGQDSNIPDEIENPIEQRPMTVPKLGEEVREMNQEELDHFWNTHCAAIKGGSCREDPENGVCTLCKLLVPMPD